MKATVRAKAAGTKLGAREALLQAAGELMNERDTLDVSLGEISARAKANSALVKYYFGNKRGLFLALIERDVIRPMSQLGYLVESDISPAEKMKVHITGLINTYYRSRYLNRLLFMLLRESTPAQAQDISDRLIKPAADAQQRILDEGQKKGEFRPVDAMLFYFTVIGACDELFTASFALKTVFKQNQIDDTLRRNLIDHTTTTLLAGIRTQSRDELKMHRFTR
jgi:TetR/AcrR family transcriptional regulator